MTQNTPTQEFNPWPNYMMIAAGALLIAARFLDDLSQWTMIDILKIVGGAVFIGVGVYKLIKK